MGLGEQPQPDSRSILHNVKYLHLCLETVFSDLKQRQNCVPRTFCIIMLTIFLKTANLIINNWVFLSDATHRNARPSSPFDKYEGKGTKISIFKLFSELGKIWKCNLGFSKIPVSIYFMNWRPNFESMDELGKFLS